MCGIIGKIIKDTSNDDVVKFVKSGFELLAHRGTDAFGCILINKDNIKTIKAIEEDTFIEGLEKALDETKYDFIIAHHRWASIGNSSDVNLQHPITKKDEDRDVSVNIIHNGTNKDLYNLLDTVGNSDTEVVAELFTNYSSTSSKMYELLLKDIGVVFAVFNNGNIYLHIDKSRPLFFSEDRTTFYSEPFNQGIQLLCKPVDKLFDSWEDLCANVEVYEKTTTVYKNIFTRKCTECSKTHLHATKTSRVCFRCDIEPLKSYSVSNYCGYNSYGSR
jgi:asparagine synthetase B (glutamine-hydrolysing)